MGSPHIIGGPNSSFYYPDHRDWDGQLFTETVKFTQLQIPALDDPQVLSRVAYAYKHLRDGKPEVYRYHIHCILEMQFRHCNHDIFFLLKPDFPTSHVVCTGSQQDRPFPRAYDKAFLSSAGLGSAITLTADREMIFDGGRECKLLPVLVVEITAEETKAADALARGIAGMQAWYETCRTGYGVVCVGMRYWRLVHGAGKLIYLEQEPALSDAETPWHIAPAIPVEEVLQDSKLLSKIPNDLVREDIFPGAVVQDGDVAEGYRRKTVERATMARLMYHVTCAALSSLQKTCLQTVMKPFYRLQREAVSELPSDLVDPATVYKPKNTDLPETLKMLSTYGIKIKIVTPHQMNELVADIERKLVTEDVEAEVAAYQVQDAKRQAEERAAAGPTPTSMC
ncbi:hypothetical protein IAT38_002234 [Cryptococcus sp. DSM 104549]